MKFKRLIKKDKFLKIADRFGITRIKNGWWIRLGHHKKRPSFQQTVCDSKFDGNAVESFKRALQIASQNRKKYSLKKYIPPSNSIKGLSLSKQANHSGKTFYFTWKVHFIENNKAKNKTFGFWISGNIYESFLKAAGFAKKKGSIFDVEKVDQFFLDYIKRIQNDNIEFLGRSDLRSIDCTYTKIVLKKKYLNN